MADVRIEIEESLKAPNEKSEARPSRRVGPIVVASLLSAALAGFAVVWWDRAPAPAQGVMSAVMHLDLTLPSGVELYTGRSRAVAVSPDGQQVAFIGVSCGVRQVFVRREPDAVVRRIRGTDIADTIFFSPDGRSLGYVDSTSSLKTISLSDDSIALLTYDIDTTGGGTWGADGRITFARENVLWQIPAAGGEARRLTELDASKGELRHAWPVSIGNGGQVMFTVITGSDRNASHIEMLTVASGKREVVVDRATYARVVPTGQLAFFRDKTLEVAGFDISRGRLNDPAARVMEDLAVDIDAVPVFDFSERGTLVYASRRTATSHLVWKSRTGSEEQISETPAGYYAPRLFDGQILVSRDGELWMQDSRKAMSVLTSGIRTGNSYPVWTSDGSKIVFHTQTGIAWITPDGAGKAQSIPGTTGSDYPSSIAPDNDTLAFVRVSPEGSGDVYALSLTGDAPARPIVTGPAYDGGAQISPDGRWLVFASNRGGEFQVYIQGFPTWDQRATPISTQGGNQPRWNANGKEIFYRQCDKMMAVDVKSDPGTSTLSLGTPHLVFEQPYLSGVSTTIPDYDVTPDGERFLMIKGESYSTLHVVLNWFDDLKRLTATK
jgi:Tol biopolymer transport system component